MPRHSRIHSNAVLSTLYPDRCNWIASKVAHQIHPGDFRQRKYRKRHEKIEDSSRHAAPGPIHARPETFLGVIMFFRILGPLDVSFQNEPVPLGKNRQRTVLATLLLDANRTVSVGRLVEAVWGGRPPKTAPEQIQTCIWRLRRTLACTEATPDPIQTTPSGYIMRVSAEQLDATLFERLVQEAKGIADTGVPSAAAERYRAALCLFTGPVLGEISSPLVQSVAAFWEERRLTALEECFDQELAGGQTVELVDELTSLVRQHPLRERLRMQLMQALHGGDRRAEALATYREGREVMVSELGLEPGPKSQELHRRILSGEPLEHETTSAPLVPAQLPADTCDFIGRRAQIATLTRLLAGSRSGPGDPTGVRISALLGQGGVGKTALAVHAAHLLRDQFPDGQLYADLGGFAPEHDGTAVVLRGFLSALGIADSQVPVTAREQLALYRSMLAERRMLVVLDDATRTDQIQGLLPNGSRTAVIITTRSTLTDLPGCTPVDVDVLSMEEALSLLRRIIGDVRADTEPAGTQDILAATGMLPLAIRAVGARIAARPKLSLAHFAERLADPGQRLDALSHGSLDVRTRLRDTVDVLPTPARQLWFALGMLGLPDFEVCTAALLSESSLAHAEKLLDDLVDHRLVEVDGVDEHGHVRYRMHELIGLYAHERAVLELPEPVRTKVSEFGVTGRHLEYSTESGS